jgi:hypothetical protein
MQVIVAGEASQPATQALLNAAHAAWAPDKALLLIDPTDDESASFWQQHNPEAWAMVDAHYKKAAAAGAGAGGGVSSGIDAAAAAEGPRGEVKASEIAAAGGAPNEAAGGAVPTAFVCQNFTCLAPTSDADKLYEQLSVRAGRAAAGSGVKLTPVKL